MALKRATLVAPPRAEAGPGAPAALESAGRPVRYLNRLGALAVLLLLAFVIAFGWASWHSIKRENVGLLTTVLKLSEKALDRYFVQTEASMHSLSLALQEDDGLVDLVRAQRLLRRHHDLHPEATAVSLISLEAQVLATSSTETLTGLPYLGSNESFQAFLRAQDAQTPLRLSRPTLGQVSKQWVFPMRYTMRDGEGRAVAYLSVAVPVAMLQGFWRDAPVVQRAAIGLIRDDGYLLSRYPVPEGRTPADLYAAPRTGTLQSHLSSQGFPRQGYVEGRNQLMGEDYANVYTRLEHFPVTLFVSMPISDFRRAWLERVQAAYLLVLLFSAIGLAAQSYAMRRQRLWEEDRRRIANDLRAREAEQRHLVDHLISGVLVYGPDVTIVRCNPQAIRLFGLTEAQLKGHSLTAFGARLLREDGSDMPADENPISRAVRERRPLRGLVLGLQFPGKPESNWLLGNVEPEFDDMGSLRRVVASFVDITARRQAERTLEHSEIRYRMLYENSHDGVFQMTADGTILRANRAACALFGLSEEALMLRGHAGIADPTDPRLRPLAAKLAGDAGVHGEITMLRGDGSRFEAEVSAAGYTDEAGQRVWGVIVRDVTDRRQAEAARAAQERAETANRAKSEFVARMSHELRTPLNAILGFSDVLQLDAQHPLDARQSDNVRHIHRAGQHLLSVIDDLLDLSRIESGEIHLVDGNLDPFEVAAEVLGELKGRATRVGVRMAVQGPARPIGQMRGDRTRVKQVLLNLVSNAIKYNRPDGRVDVVLSATGSKVLLDVRDSGLGMTPAQVEALFQPFNRLGREGSGVEGTGIGLVITRNLVEVMGGTLTVSSEPAVGSTFRVELPWVAGTAAPAPLAPAVTEAPPAEPIGGVTVRVLYIDDDPINCLLVESLLALRADVTLAVARDGPEGLALAATFRPDLLMTDMMMPSMSGLEVLAAIRADPELRGTRCLAVSASAMPEQIEAAMREGFDGYLTKPLPAAVLYPEIDKVVRAVAKPS